MADVIIFANSAMLTLKPEIIHLRNPHFNIKQDTHGTSIKQCFFYRFRQSLPKVLRQKQNSHKTDYFIPKRALELPTPSPGYNVVPIVLSCPPGLQKTGLTTLQDGGWGSST